MQQIERKNSMKSKDWLLTSDGQCQACKTVREWDLLREYYRFYRFLTEVEDALNAAPDSCSCLPAMRRLVRQLITNSYWVQTQHPEPCLKTGVSVMMLYDEIGFPLTVQTVTFMPGTSTPIHNHGTWGVVAVLKGQEKNTFWKRTHDPQFQDKLEKTGEKTLLPGELISFTPDAIHSIEAVGDEPTVTFNIYGDTKFSKRFEFDPVTHTSKHY